MGQTSSNRFAAQLLKLASTHHFNVTDIKIPIMCTRYTVYHKG